MCGTGTPNKGGNGGQTSPVQMNYVFWDYGIFSPPKTKGYYGLDKVRMENLENRFKLGYEVCRFG